VADSDQAFVGGAQSNKGHQKLFTSLNVPKVFCNSCRLSHKRVYFL